MARYHIDATWNDGYVELEFRWAAPLTPEHAAHLTEAGMLRADDEPVSQVQLGQLRITEPMQMTTKRVRAAAVAWLAEHAGYTDTDSYEMLLAVRGTLDALERLEAAVGA